MTGKFYSHGKLLITGEYAVLDGARALAVPTKFGQSLVIAQIKERIIQWTALDYQEKTWFKTTLKFDGANLELMARNPLKRESEERLLQILTQAHKLNPEVLNPERGYKIFTKLDFPQNWGLGSSSTLINNVAQWFQVDPYILLENTFKGSGYDIAAGKNEKPIIYQLTKKTRSVLITDFNPVFKDNLFFVHLNQKQNSRESIIQYQGQKTEKLQNLVSRISALTQLFINCSNLEEFKILIEIHETLVSKLINTPKVKTTLFPDFPGAIKSLGGWGGDFILATGTDIEMNYFRNKGYLTILSYKEMVK